MSKKTDVPAELAGNTYSIMTRLSVDKKDFYKSRANVIIEKNGKPLTEEQIQGLTEKERGFIAASMSDYAWKFAERFYPASKAGYQEWLKQEAKKN